MGEVIISIYGSVGRAFVARWNKGQQEDALNWAELSEEALQAIMPELRRRWSDYWQQCVQRASIAKESHDPKEIMYEVPLPDPHYACPPEIAAKAIWRSVNERTLLVVESSLGQQVK